MVGSPRLQGTQGRLPRSDLGTLSTPRGTTFLTRSVLKREDRSFLDNILQTISISYHPSNPFLTFDLFSFILNYTALILAPLTSPSPSPKRINFHLLLCFSDTSCHLRFFSIGCPIKALYAYQLLIARESLSLRLTWSVSLFSPLSFSPPRLISTRALFVQCPFIFAPFTSPWFHFHLHSRARLSVQISALLRHHLLLGHLLYTTSATHLRLWSQWSSNSLDRIFNHIC